MLKHKVIAISALALMGSGLLGACDFPGGEKPTLPDLPPQICDLLPHQIPGCDNHDT